MTKKNKKIPKNLGFKPPERPSSLVQFGAALRLRREELGFTLDQLAQKTAISKPYLSNIETGRAPGPPSEEKLLTLATALIWSEQELVAAADWLRTPQSVRALIANADTTKPYRRQDGAINLDALVPTQHAPDKKHPRNPPDSPFIKVVQVPVINRVTAGRAAEHGDLDYPAGIADDYVPAPDLPNAPIKSAFALKIIGDSMSPDYPEGEIIIVGPAEPQDGDDCVVRLGEDTNYATTFKRIFFIRRGNQPTGEVESVRLVALNPKYAERMVRTEQVSGIYPLMYRLSPAKRSGSDRSDEQHTAAKAIEPPDPRGHGSYTSRVSIEHD